jgi:gamma-glutamylcyclotransferase (GGCT)/AIG2-like uncharacterized protein YtfP
MPVRIVAPSDIKAVWDTIRLPEGSAEPKVSRTGTQNQDSKFSLSVVQQSTVRDTETDYARTAVYGTLMRANLPSTPRRATFIGDAQTQPLYRLFNVGDYPALVMASPGRSISGELWRVSDETRRILDNVEGLDEGLYTRCAVRLQSPFDAVNVETYIYLQSIADLPDIGKSWRERHA